MTDLKEERLKDSDLKRQAMSGFWRRFLERFGAQGVILVVSIVLARMLDPQVYGMVAIVTIFTALLNVFADSGLGSALIHKRDADEMYFSTVFFFNVFRSVVLYLKLFSFSPDCGILSYAGVEYCTSCHEHNSHYLQCYKCSTGKCI